MLSPTSWASLELGSNGATGSHRWRALTGSRAARASQPTATHRRSPTRRPKRSQGRARPDCKPEVRSRSRRIALDRALRLGLALCASRVALSIESEIKSTAQGRLLSGAQLSWRSSHSQWRASGQISRASRARWVCELCWRVSVCLLPSNACRVIYFFGGLRTKPQKRYNSPLFLLARVQNLRVRLRVARSRSESLKVAQSRSKYLRVSPSGSQLE